MIAESDNSIVDNYPETSYDDAEYVSYSDDTEIVPDEYADNTVFNNYDNKDVTDDYPADVSTNDYGVDAGQDHDTAEDVAANAAECPGGDLESCVDVCPGNFGARVFGLCVASCGRRCP